MASLKDMRVRLASTKATQKITKAMQMVAASKLRRAQAAAEAARPYAERMEKVLGNIAATVADINSAPRLLAGTGQDQVHLLGRPGRPHRKRRHQVRSSRATGNGLSSSARGVSPLKVLFPSKTSLKRPSGRSSGA